MVPFTYIDMTRRPQKEWVYRYWTTHHDLANNQHISSPVSREPCEEGDHQAAGAAVEALSRRIEAELRAAKRTHLACGEVLLPCGLLQRIASDIVSMAESEPCGLRGCRLYLLFEASAPASSASCASPERRRSIRLGAVHCDPATASTFELYLTLRQSSTGWHFLPQFIRNLTRGGTIVVSPAYTLSKKKLYRSYREE
ncbi:hypothetical protein NQ318_022477 [Aromia moschata]|uniref:Protein charybde n=1 Tax=Aromia moschata TaxID=1265417 RepID=A0AAV8Z581_9CUCU|nr:hypothetical protein NQ318_022477 [Aromia moschata]